MLARLRAKLRFEFLRLLNRLLALHGTATAGAPWGDAEMLAAMPPLFIVGAPRTGSTALYQYLTHVFEAAYIDNISANFYGSLCCGLAISRALGGQGAHGCFDSELGDTRAGGGFAPHECGEFWYRWVSREEHYVGRADVTPRMVNGLRREIAVATRQQQRPIVFKNLYVGQRLELIRQALPEARIVYCRRDRVATVRSILAARERLGWPVDRLWSARPRGWRKLEGLPVVEQVAAQVVWLERQIEVDLLSFPPQQVMVVDYEEWVGAEGAMLDRMGGFTGWRRRIGSALPVRRPAGDRSLDPRQAAEITSALAKWAAPERGPV